MKYLLPILMPFVLLASQEKISVSEHNSIHSHTQKPIIKINNRQKMHTLHKIVEEEIKAFVKKETGEEITTLKLSHEGRVLFYKVKTPSFNMKINALDKIIISKEKR